MFIKWEKGFLKDSTLLVLCFGAAVLFSLSFINAGCDQPAPGAVEGEQDEINAEQAEEELTGAPAVGSLAPDFALTDLLGNEKSPADFRGEMTLLTFWTTWCSYCQEEMELLQSIHEREDAAVLAVNVEEREGTVQEFIQQEGYTFPVVLDRDGDVFQQYRLRGFPSTFVLDEQGEIVSIHIGPLNVEDLEEILQGSPEQRIGPA